MKIYDVSIALHPGMPVWPGDPPLTLERVNKIEAGANANVSHFASSVHVGTHVDAPYHFLPDGSTVEQMPLAALVGRATVVEFMDADTITAADLQAAGLARRTRRVLFRTRNSQYWARGERQFQTGFVGLQPEAADWLARRGIRLVGIDYLSIAPYQASRPTHEILLKAGVVIVEGLDLSQIPAGRYMLYCLPLKLVGSDGAPARVILIG